MDLPSEINVIILSYAWDFKLSDLEIQQTWKSLIRLCVLSHLPIWYDGLHALLRDASELNHETFFCDAYQYGDLLLCQWLDKRVMWTDSLVAHVFAIACQGGHRHLVEWLRNRRPLSLTKEAITCSSSSGSSSGWHALMYALGGGHLDIAEWIIDEFKLSEQDVTGPKTYQFAPLELDFTFCSKCSHYHHPHHHYYNQRYRSWSCLTASKPMTLLEVSFANACINGHLREAKWISSKSKIADAKLFDTVLTAACSEGHVDVARWLVQEHGANLDTYKYRTALSDACRRGSLDVCHWLTATYSDPEEADHCGHLLQVACGNGQLEVAKWLLGKYHKYKRQLRSARFSAFSNACEGGHLAVAQWLHETMCITQYGARVEIDTVFKETCKERHLSVAQWLHKTFSVDKDPDVFFQVCDTGCVEVARWLHVTFGFSKGYSKRKRQAFVDSCHYGNVEMVRWLHETFDLKLAAHPSKLCKALTLACSEQHMHLVHWLFKTFECTKQRALGIFKKLCKYGSLEGLKWLQDRFQFSGQDVQLENGKMLLLAEDNHHFEVMKWLLETFCNVDDMDDDDSCLSSYYKGISSMVISRKRKRYLDS